MYFSKTDQEKQKNKSFAEFRWGDTRSRVAGVNVTPVTCEDVFFYQNTAGEGLALYRETLICATKK